MLSPMLIQQSGLMEEHFAGFGQSSDKGMLLS
jgi:hypothetical protein